MLKEPGEYFSKAVEAERLAAQVDTVFLKDAFLEMAKAYRHLAVQARAVREHKPD